MATAAEILSMHQSSSKTTGTWTGYSIQFTYPTGKKNQFIGKTEDEVRQNMADAYHTSAVYAFKAGCDIITIASIIGLLEYWGCSSIQRNTIALNLEDVEALIITLTSCIKSQEV